MATTAPWINTFEPKREHKFILELNNIKVYFITDVTIPQPSVTDTAVHNFLSHKFKFPGKLSWGDSIFTLVDPIDLNAAGLLIQHLRGSGYVFPSSFNEQDSNNPNWYLRTIKKSGPADNAVNILDGLKIVSLTSEGQPVEKWLLKNPFVKTVDFGKFDYNTENLKNIKITLSVDWVDYESILPTAFTTAPSPT